MKRDVLVRVSKFCWTSPISASSCFRENLLDFICLVSFLFPFYVDEFNTMIVRIRSGDNLLRAHRKHVYQLLANEKGIVHWKVSVGYGLFQTVVGLFFSCWSGFQLSLSLALLSAKALAAPPNPSLPISARHTNGG